MDGDYKDGDISEYIDGAGDERSSEHFQIIEINSCQEDEAGVTGTNDKASREVYSFPNEIWPNNETVGLSDDPQADNSRILLKRKTPEDWTADSVSQGDDTLVTYQRKFLRLSEAASREESHYTEINVEEDEFAWLDRRISRTPDMASSQGQQLELCPPGRTTPVGGTTFSNTKQLTQLMSFIKSSPTTQFGILVHCSNGMYKADSVMLSLAFPELNTCGEVLMKEIILPDYTVNDLKDFFSKIQDSLCDKRETIEIQQQQRKSKDFVLIEDDETGECSGFLPTAQAKKKSNQDVPDSNTKSDAKFIQKPYCSGCRKNRKSLMDYFHHACTYKGPENTCRICHLQLYDKFNIHLKKSKSCSLELKKMYYERKTLEVLDCENSGMKTSTKEKPKQKKKHSFRCKKCNKAWGSLMLYSHHSCVYDGPENVCSACNKKVESSKFKFHLKSNKFCYQKLQEQHYQNIDRKPNGEPKKLKTKYLKCENCKKNMKPIFYYMHKCQNPDDTLCRVCKKHFAKVKYLCNHVRNTLICKMTVKEWQLEEFPEYNAEETEKEDKIGSNKQAQDITASVTNIGTKVKAEQPNINDYLSTQFQMTYKPKVLSKKAVVTIKNTNEFREEIRKAFQEEQQHEESIKEELHTSIEIDNTEDIDDNIAAAPEESSKFRSQNDTQIRDTYSQQENSGKIEVFSHMCKLEPQNAYEAENANAIKIPKGIEVSNEMAGANMDHMLAKEAMTSGSKKYRYGGCRKCKGCSTPTCGTCGFCESCHGGMGTSRLNVNPVIKDYNEYRTQSPQQNSEMKRSSDVAKVKGHVARKSCGARKSVPAPRVKRYARKSCGARKFVPAPKKPTSIPRRRHSSYYQSSSSSGPSVKAEVPSDPDSDSSSSDSDSSSSDSDSSSSDSDSSSSDSDQDVIKEEYWWVDYLELPSAGNYPYQIKKYFKNHGIPIRRIMTIECSNKKEGMHYFSIQVVKEAAMKIDAEDLKPGPCIRLQKNPINPEYRVDRSDN